jgi:hypothetical protein
MIGELEREKNLVAVQRGPDASLQVLGSILALLEEQFDYEYERDKFDGKPRSALREFRKEWTKKQAKLVEEQTQAEKTAFAAREAERRAIERAEYDDTHADGKLAAIRDALDESGFAAQRKAELLMACIDELTAIRADEKLGPILDALVSKEINAERRIELAAACVAEIPQALVRIRAKLGREK